MYKLQIYHINIVRAILIETRDKINFFRRSLIYLTYLITRLIRGTLCSTADTILAGNLAETMKLEPYQMYQTSPPASHQQQTGPPPPYYEAQYQRNNGLRTSSSASYGLPPTPQSANQQRCPIHGLQPCACQMVSPKFLADFSREDTTILHKGGRQRFYVAHVRPGNVAKSIRIVMYVLHKHTYIRTNTNVQNVYLSFI